MAIPSASTVKKLRRLQTYIRKEPRRFNMSIWGLAVKLPEGETIDDLQDQHPYGYDQNRNQISTEFLNSRPPCGTVVCLAGSVLLMANLTKPKFRIRGFSLFSFSARTPVYARRYLGLPEGDAKKLFFIHGWPLSFSESFDDLSPVEQVERACARLDYYIETGQ